MDDCVTFTHLVSRDTFEGIFVCLFVWWCGGGYTKYVEKCFETALHAINFVLLCCKGKNVFLNMHVLCVDLYASSDTFEVIFSTLQLSEAGVCHYRLTPKKQNAIHPLLKEAGHLQHWFLDLHVFFGGLSTVDYLQYFTMTWQCWYYWGSLAIKMMSNWKVMLEKIAAFECGQCQTLTIGTVAEWAKWAE